MRIDRASCLAVVALVAVGCGTSVKIVPVSGAVTLDGKPLANAHVSFQPEAAQGIQTAGAGSYGTTDLSGAYSLRVTGTDQAGAVVGTHRVAISLKVESDDRDPRLRSPAKTLPDRYSRNSELQFKVEPGGTDKANFELKSK
jgi:hypothetical protein